jgi:S1-C subfamily serine protease
LELSTWAGTDFSTDVEAISEGPDLALLSASAARPRPTIDTSAQSVGTQVWAAGYPEGDQLAVTPGKVVRYVDGAQFDEPGQIMEITNAIQHGNSGGPLLDDHDKVVGVVFAIDTLNNYGLAIPASTLAAFMSSPGNNTTSPCADVTETGNTGVGNTGTGDTASGAVNVGAVSGSPFAAPVQQTLETYFEGIDARDFTAAYSAYSARFQGSLSETSFATADGTSTISSVSVSSVVAQMNDDLKADVTFTSVQAAQDGPVPGQTCTNWSLEYILVPAPAGNPLSYLIDSVAPISAGHTAC